MSIDSINPTTITINIQTTEETTKGPGTTSTSPESIGGADKSDSSIDISQFLDEIKTLLEALLGDNKASEAKYNNEDILALLEILEMFIDASDAPNTDKSKSKPGAPTDLSEMPKIAPREEDEDTATTDVGTRPSPGVSQPVDTTPTEEIEGVDDSDSSIDISQILDQIKMLLEALLGDNEASEAKLTKKDILAVLEILGMFIDASNAPNTVQSRGTLGAPTDLSEMPKIADVVDTPPAQVTTGADTQSTSGYKTLSYNLQTGGVEHR